MGVYHLNYYSSLSCMAANGWSCTKSLTDHNQNLIFSSLGHGLPFHKLCLKFLLNIFVESCKESTSETERSKDIKKNLGKNIASSAEVRLLFFCNGYMYISSIKLKNNLSLLNLFTITVLLYKIYNCYLCIIY